MLQLTISSKTSKRNSEKNIENNLPCAQGINSLGEKLLENRRSRLAKMAVRLSFLLAIGLAMIALALAVPMPGSLHPKFRRSAELYNKTNTTGILLVVVKENNATRLGPAGESPLLDFLSSRVSVSEENETAPIVRSYTDIGIGYAVDMNEAALKKVHTQSGIQLTDVFG